MVRLKVGIIGCGAIGGYIAGAIDRGMVDADLVVIFDINIEKAKELVKKLYKVKPKVAKSISEVLSEDLDIVIESASQEAVKMYAIDILKSGKNLLVLSTGALLDEDLHKSILEVAKKRNVKIYVPSGAMGGLDALKAASILGIDELTLITVKDPKALGLNDLDEPLVVFEGDADGAVKRFPLNVNIAATMTLTTNRKPKVRIIADPNAKENVHEIYAKGAFGEIILIMKNKKIEGSLRTSLIAALSAIQLLRQLSEGILIVGT